MVGVPNNTMAGGGFDLWGALAELLGGAGVPPPPPATGAPLPIPQMPQPAIPAVGGAAAVGGAMPNAATVGGPEAVLPGLGGQMMQGGAIGAGAPTAQAAGGLVPQAPPAAAAQQSGIKAPQQQSVPFPGAPQLRPVDLSPLIQMMQMSKMAGGARPSNMSPFLGPMIGR